MSEFPRPDAVLPHRPPFLFVDEVTALQPGAACTSNTQCSEGRCIAVNDSGTGVCAYPAPIGAVRYCQR